VSRSTARRGGQRDRPARPGTEEPARRLDGSSSLVDIPQHRLGPLLAAFPGRVPDHQSFDGLGGFHTAGPDPGPAPSGSRCRADQPGRRRQQRYLSPSHPADGPVRTYRRWNGTVTVRDGSVRSRLHGAVFPPPLQPR